ncbi:M15 family metallopeptidase [Fundidesulfovibrio agrisoli]|uniref:M15 family metallopeptidase n=1 Tax=Fundidesulfovibrio agrisoli TaxID=2922717 RepID=UPI001FAE6513|nr:M15 family metallopeptidase [Fundidesulfovibrio agrisoli]
MTVRRLLCAALLACVCAIPAACAAPSATPNPSSQPAASSGNAVPRNQAQADLELLKRTYPDVVASVSPDGLTLRDGTRLPYDDGRSKTPEQALDDADLQDMLAQPYPLAPVTAEPGPGVHPGRVRVTAFFKAAYGHTPEEVKASLVSVRFLGATVQFNSRNGAAKALEAVNADLERLLAANPELRRFVLPVSGTFAWRQIAGTQRLSMHSFGAAIDLNAKVNTYWQWYKGNDPLGLRKAFPAEVVEVFERHGFVWGGKWAEFDIMHFEYRPEMIAKAGAPR